MLASGIVVMLGLLALGFMGLFFASGMPFGAGYQPVPRKAIGAMLDFSDPEGKAVYDLGSGFGRILFEASARNPRRCVGVEIDPLKCWWTRMEANRRGLQGVIEVVRANLLDVDLSEADVVLVFLTPRLMKKLKRKAVQEMKPGSVVVSYDHRFEGWAPEVEDAELNVRLYRVPSRLVIARRQPND
ncbi:MAG: class I SAM-dependent methyltransferase [Nitrososphaerota archaeon]|nr:class I SAM-dependent methyltransferase [Nitrososphaerota archaeon]